MVATQTRTTGRHASGGLERRGAPPVTRQAPCRSKIKFTTPPRTLLNSCGLTRCGRRRSVGMMAFGESLAFIALVLPAWAILVAVGTLISQGGLNFWPIWVAGAIGAALGDRLSYWVGSKVGPAVALMWPLSRHPYLIPRGERFVAKWGALAIFIGRFLGPLRAVVPLVAGIFAMPFWPFQIANFVSALAWVAMLLMLGDAV